jgi:hypothetical protein
VTLAPSAHVEEDARMSESEGGAAPRRRRWLFVAAAAWSLLGLWNLFSGDVWIGCAELVLAAVSLTAGMSSRVASIVDAPLFRRK